MIDPIHSLAFSVQANPGVYAVLLGSGISRSAQIPTGWEITLDLVRKLSTVSGEPCEPTPELWYRDKFGHDPDYSELLDALAKTPAERQQLLRGYWEATETEREEGAKRPTSAHRAIASLVERGFIKVILTTNFDRLMETALADVGIIPTVLSSPDQVHGALPLIHTRCCLFKVHGDYLDTRIRNTPDELADYPEEFNQLLDRIFDEFGLIVCGWSADWDDALCRAITRATSRRFAHYWAVYGGKTGKKAQQLVEQRGGQVISINGADSFFQTLQQLVESLEEFSRPHPLSTEAAVASLKRYLSEPKYRIQLADLVAGEVTRIIDATSGPKFALQGGPSPNAETMNIRVREYEALCVTLLTMAPVGGFWAEETHYYIWQNALIQLAERPSGNGAFTLWTELQRYPACLLLFALGIGAVESGRLEFLGKLFATPVLRENYKDRVVTQVLPPFRFFQTSDTAKLLKGVERNYAPLNDWIYDVLKPYLQRISASDSRLTLAFDKFEILMALSFAYQGSRNGENYWAPPGAYGYRHENRERIFAEIADSLTVDGDSSPFVCSRIFGDTAKTCVEGFVLFKKFAEEISSGWW